MKRAQQTNHALGSDALLTLVVDDSANPDELFATLWQKIAAFEARFSRFLPTSELTMFNNAAGRRVPVTLAFRALLLAAKKWNKQTHGLYNPFVLPALQRAGYVGSWPTPQHAQKHTNFKNGYVVDAMQLRIGKTWASIPTQTALDFGGIGKGYLLDQLADYLHGQPAVSGFWLSLGGDIICSGHDHHNQPWRVGVQHATQPQTAIDYLQVSGTMAVATSGITKRRGEDWHHLINPQTGQPAVTDLLTATVSASNATAADIYAKCMVLLGAQKAQTFAPKINQAILQTASGDIITFGSN